MLSLELMNYPKCSYVIHFSITVLEENVIIYKHLIEDIPIKNLITESTENKI